MRLATGHYVTVEKGSTAQQMSALWKHSCCLTWSWQWANHHTIISPPEEAGGRGSVPGEGDGCKIGVGRSCARHRASHMNMNGHHIITIWIEVSRSEGPHPKVCKCRGYKCLNLKHLKGKKSKPQLTFQKKLICIFIPTYKSKKDQAELMFIPVAKTLCYH